MKTQTIGYLLLGVTATAIVGFGVVVSSNRRELPQVNQPVSIMRAQTSQVGGVNRPRSDVESRDKRVRTEEAVQISLKASEEAIDSRRFPYGHTPLVDPSTNPSTMSVYSALKGEDESDRHSLNPYAQIEPFDMEKYVSDREAYLQKIEPARVWQSAQPGTDVPRLMAITPRTIELTQGESTTLRVKTSANAPTTFVAFDGGAFENHLSVITVEADADGVASVQFTATPGAIAKARVLASSPLASGNRDFIVDIKLPIVR